jgi:hypothetical protein
VKTIVMLLLAATLGLATAPAYGGSLSDQLPDGAARVGISGGSAFDSLAEAIADTAARSLPVVSASAGFTYRYNPALEVFERSSQTLGPIFLERPDTLGRSKVNVSVSYQYVRFDSFDGDDIDSLEAPDPIITNVVSGGVVTGANATELRYDLGLSSHVVGLSATYGVLDDLDVNILVPLIATSFDTGVSSNIVATAPVGGAFTPATGFQSTDIDGDAFGVGDILLRGKYLFAHDERLRAAAGLTLRLPSGDEDDFQGTGSFEASPAIYLSTLLWERVSPHFNLAVDLNADDVSRSQVRYGIGIDGDVLPRLGLSLAFLGRSEFDGIADESDTEFLHLVGGVNGTPQQKPLLGLDFDRKDYFDLSFGVRFVVWREVMLFANGLVALNDDGLRNDTVIPLIGVEGTF